MKVTEKTTNLNSNEIKVLKAVCLSSEDIAGGDFTDFNELMNYISDMEEKQVKGYLSQLKQKNYIQVNRIFGLVQINNGSLVDHLSEYKFEDEVKDEVKEEEENVASTKKVKFSKIGNSFVKQWFDNNKNSFQYEFFKTETEFLIAQNK